MSQPDNKIGKSMIVNWLLLALLLITGEFTLTSCGIITLKSKPAQQQIKNQPPQAEQQQGKNSTIKVNKEHELDETDTTDDDDPE